jgi:hypothetical protein
LRPVERRATRRTRVVGDACGCTVRVECLPAKVPTKESKLKMEAFACFRSMRPWTMNFSPALESPRYGCSVCVYPAGLAPHPFYSYPSTSQRRITQIGRATSLHTRPRPPQRPLDRSHQCTLAPTLALHSPSLQPQTLCAVDDPQHLSPSYLTPPSPPPCDSPHSPSSSSRP